MFFLTMYHSNVEWYTSVLDYCNKKAGGIEGMEEIDWQKEGG